MSSFDPIIGYSGIKRELERTADILSNIGFYKDAGAKIPSGMLIHGAPGLGKTLMAKCLIEASGLATFTIRKDKADGTFVDYIKETFDKATNAAPCIVFLDDMDKFANNDGEHRNAEEFVTLQACIDAVKGKDVFVLATTNDLDYLPTSLTRAGRFDRRIDVHTPTGTEAHQIVEHYLAGTSLDDDIEIQDIVMLMEGSSCAVLEAILNEARLNSVSRRAESISKADFMGAFLKEVVRMPLGDSSDQTAADNPDLKAIAVHEAGHAAIYEILFDRATSLATAFRKRYDRGGITYVSKPAGTTAGQWATARILGALGGKAATDLVFGVCDEGAGSDLTRASHMLFDRIGEAASCGMSGLSDPSGPARTFLQDNQRAMLAAELERYYQKAKQVLAANREFLDKLADAIAGNEYLVSSDIQAIKATCTIVPVEIGL